MRYFFSYRCLHKQLYTAATNDCESGHHTPEDALKTEKTFGLCRYVYDLPEERTNESPGIDPCPRESKGRPLHICFCYL